ncbi:MAG TPA: formate/nitrite transporter family protein [Terriglobales bacterium]|nr:formate/nitrite transporter family protein [Terriglobales bacterium]
MAQKTTPEAKTIARVLAAIKPQRNDEAQKSYRRILEQEINEGMRELGRPTLGLLISGLSAGLDVSFSALVMAVVLSWSQDLSTPARELLLAASYAVGYILVIMGRSELFTEHTTRSVYPVLHGDASLLALARLWCIVYLSNLAGCAAFAKVITVIGPPLNVVQPWSLGYMARNLVAHSGWVIFVSAILAGWMMGLLSWLVTAGRDSMGQIAIVALITGTIGICHLPHCVVGTTEVLAGYLAHQGITFQQFTQFLFWATLGNACGGIVFVALIKYGHVMNAVQDPEYVELEAPPAAS